MLIHDQEGKTWRMNQQLQPFNVSQWTPRKVNTCHLSVHRLQAFQPLPMVNPEETESAGLQAPDGWGTYQGDNFNEPWLLHLPIHRIYVFPGGSAGKESGCNAADLGSIPGLGRSPGEGNSYTHSRILNLSESVFLKPKLRIFHLVILPAGCFLRSR